MHRTRRGSHGACARSLTRSPAGEIVRACCLGPDSRTRTTIGANQFVRRPVSQGLAPINRGEDRRARIRVVAGAGGVVAWVDAVGIVGIASAGHGEDGVGEKSSKERWSWW